MKTITIPLSDKEYSIVMAVANRRRKSPASLFKKIMFQLNDNDEIAEYTGKRKGDASVMKRNCNRRKR